MAFSFENLTVYKDALAWVEEVQKFLQHLGKHCPRIIANQLSRAALSIPLNIAEGNGRWHKGEKKQFFWVARGSIFECVAILQVMAKLGLLKDDEHTEYYDNMTKLAKMITNLIKSVENLNQKSEENAPSAGKRAVS